MRTSPLEVDRMAQLADLEIESNGLPQLGGLDIEPNGHHAGNHLDRVDMGMEIDPNGAPWFGPTVDPAGTFHAGGLDIEPNG